ncbi:MAG: hypothetical protein DME46_07380 [Verrucomicrobia bacterium]|nr:MAG: hypothetical protein DME46_07380 [Verrucomicrobiota bacterium]
MLRVCWILISLLFAADLQGAIISGFAAGFANQTPGFWGIEFQSGAPGERIASVALKMPGPGFFDFDGVDNYQNQTAPIFDAGSSFGLSAGQVFFSFTGEHPKVLRIRFAPDAFAPGDRLQFAADIDGLGSKVGGALGGYGGVQMNIGLSDGRRGVTNFRTDTEVASRVTLEIGPSVVPETGRTIWLLLCAGLILCALDTLPWVNGFKCLNL